MKLNIGCGQYKLEGYVNIDADSEISPDVLASADALPYESGTVAEIYAGHVYEHMSQGQGFAALREWLRVLVRGGVATVVIPDAMKICRSYANGEMVESEASTLLVGSPERPLQAHQRLISIGTLLHEMAHVGFEDVRLVTNWSELPMVSFVAWQSVAQARKPIA